MGFPYPGAFSLAANQSAVVGLPRHETVEAGGMVSPVRVNELGRAGGDGGGAGGDREAGKTGSAPGRPCMSGDIRPVNCQDFYRLDKIGNCVEKAFVPRMQCFSHRAIPLP